MQQIVGYRAVRIMTVCAVFRNRWMFVYKRTLLLGVAFVANHVDCRLSEVAFRLAVGIVAIGAGNFSFSDWMVGR